MIIENARCLTVGHVTTEPATLTIPEPAEILPEGPISEVGDGTIDTAVALGIFERYGGPMNGWAKFVKAADGKVYIYGTPPPFNVDLATAGIAAVLRAAGLKPRGQAPTL